MRYCPIVFMGETGRWATQGGADATIDNQTILDHAGVTWRRIPMLTREVHPVKDFLALQQLVRLFRQFRPSIVHTHTSKAGVLGRIAAMLTGVPVIIHTPHGHVFYGHFGPLTSWVFLSTERWLAKWTTRLIGLTESERLEHLERGVGTAEAFDVAPSGIDLEPFRSWVGVRGHRPSGFSCQPDALVVGSVGWLTSVKGHKILLEAVGRLRTRFPQLHILMVGRGELEGELRALGHHLGLEGTLTFLGERQDVPECLAAMDIFVLPSLNEGMGRALIEAMAAGRPVIASEVGGIPAVVRHRETGVLVRPGNIEDLEHALLEYIQRPDWRKEIGARASESIGERFSTAYMVGAIESTYETALRGGDRASRSNS